METNNTTPITICLFGKFYVEREGEELDFQNSVKTRILALLALEYEREISFEYIEDNLNFEGARQRLSELRKVIGNEYLPNSHDAWVDSQKKQEPVVQLALPTRAIDLALFELLITQNTVESLAAALVLADRGPLLAGWSDVFAVEARLKWNEKIERARSKYRERHEQRLAAAAFYQNPSLKLARYSTKFIGRENDMTTLATAVNANQIVFVLGTGGIGKTRLVLETVSKMELEGYTYFVEMVSVSVGTQVAMHVARTVGTLTLESEDPGISLVNHFKNLNALLILDNCEHIADACADLIVLLKVNCPHLKIVATSRVTLMDPPIPSIVLNPLSITEANDPLPPNEMLQDNAVRLFLECTQTMPSSLTNDEVLIVWKTCRRLEGIPLAIELAAARARMMMLTQLYDSLEKWITSTAKNIETGKSRQRTVSNCIAWSVDHLSKEEKILFRRISVFSGGCTVEECEQVCIWGDIEDEDVIGLMESLEKNSLIYRAGDAATIRFRILEPIRLYAGKQLELNNETQVVEDKLKDLLMSLGAWENPRSMFTTTSTSLFIEEDDNLSELLQRMEKAEPSEKAEISFRSGMVRIFKGQILKVMERVDLPIHLVPNQKVRLKLYMGQAVVAFFGNEFDKVIQLTNQCLLLAEETGDRHSEAMALMAMGVATAFSYYPKMCPEAETQLIAAHTIACNLDKPDPWLIALGNMAAGANSWSTKRIDTATRFYKLAYEGLKACEDMQLFIYSINSYAHLERRHGDSSHGAELYLESFALSRKHKNRRGMAGCILGTAGMCYATGHSEEAARFWGAASQYYAQIGSKLIPPIQHDYDEDMAAVRALLGEERYESACSSGRTMKFEAALAAAEKLMTEMKSATRVLAVVRVESEEAEASYYK